MKSFLGQSRSAILAGLHRIRPASKFQLFSLLMALFAIVTIPYALGLIGKSMITGLVKYSILYQFGFNGKVSGRMDGNVMMRNGRGRGMTVPRLVHTIYTNGSRGIVNIYSAGWRALTTAQQESWNNYKLTKSDRWGQPFTVSGKQAYISSNANLTNIGGVILTSAPAPQGALNETISNMTAAVTGNVLEFDVADLDANSEYLVFATPGLSNGVFRPGLSEFRMLGEQPAAVGGTVDIYAMWTARFGTLTTGTKIFIFTRAINKNTGEASFGSTILSDTVAA